MPHTLQFHRCPDAQLPLLALHCNSLLVAVQARKPLEIFKVALKVSRTFYLLGEITSCFHFDHRKYQLVADLELLFLACHRSSRWMFVSAGD